MALGVISGSTTQKGKWTSACASTSRDGRYAHFYTLTLDEERFVRIDLTSETDAYLYLRNGAGKTGSIRTSDDDDGEGRNSRIVEEKLPAGEYTIEATTFSRAKTGDFTLFVISPLPTVAVVADKPLPAKGDTVTLTAQIANPIPDLTPTYKWEQQQEDEKWKKLTGTKETLEVTSSNADVRAFRATAEYTDLGLPVSSTIHVVWDELALYDSLIDDLVARVVPTGAIATSSPASAKAYSSAENAFLKCVNGTQGITHTYTSTAEVMGSYRQAVMAAVDACEGDDHRYVGPMLEAFKQGISEIRGSGTVRDRLLKTDRGMEFFASYTNPVLVKQFSSLFSAQGHPIGGISGASDHEEVEGLNCFNHVNRLGRPVNEVSVGARFAALNCIALSTPHKFWVDLETAGADRTAYMAAFCKDPKRKWDESCLFTVKDGKTDSRNKYDWINYGDLKCSAPDIDPSTLTIAGAQDVILKIALYAAKAIIDPITGNLRLGGCLKHDLTWGGLQGFDGGNTHNNDDDKELDSAWNPRNKFLSDAQFLLDQLCPDAERSACLDENEEYWEGMKEVSLLQWYNHALVATGGVAKFNDIGWPITTQDIADARGQPYYRPCGAEPVPHLDDIQVEERISGGYKLTADISSGCVSGIEITEAECFIRRNVPCTARAAPEVDDDEVTFYIRSGSHTEFRFVLYPADRVYGGDGYSKEYAIPPDNS